MVDASAPQEENWVEVIPESEHVLRGVSMVGGHLVVSRLEDAKSVVKVYDPNGQHARDVDLPGIGTAYGFGGKSDEAETFYSFTGFTDPTTIYQYDVTTGERELWKTSDVPFDPKQFETKQVFYTSKDGTRCPCSWSQEGPGLTTAPTHLLYGYGGFNISITPRYSSSVVAWLEQGGIYAVANLRGGGEYGEEWHEQGIKLNKQNVFDDFIAAGEWLVSEGWTSPEHLAINGRSNGGLLVGATMTQRPDLFAAAVPGVGVLDMLRYHQFTIGWAWADDYGIRRLRGDFQYLFGYSRCTTSRTARLTPRRWW